MNWFWEPAPEFIALAAELCGHDLPWGEGETLEERARWVGEHCHFILRFRGKAFVGYVAMQPGNGSDWLPHFGTTDAATTADLLAGGRLVRRLADQNDRKLVTYIGDDAAVRRIARLFNIQVFDYERQDS